MGMHIDAATKTEEKHPPVSRSYAWAVFVLIIGLMLSDYLSRQVINAIFPSLKSDWGLSDTQLGSLVSVVALVVGTMTLPISILADRFGRVKSVTIMAIVWSAATIACGLSGNFVSLFIARALVGLGEAGYSSAGGAILTYVFPKRLHSTVIGAFLAAALFGSVLGVVLGGMIAKALGWHMAFILVGAVGFLLAIGFPLVVKEPRPSTPTGMPTMPLREMAYELVRYRTIRWTYIGSGFAMFVQGSVIAWIPSYVNRYYGLDPAESAMRAGVLVLLAGIGMTLGGALADRLSVKKGKNRLRVPAAYGLISGLILITAFFLPPGTVQFATIGLGLFISAGFAGPSGAVVAEITSPSIRATAFAAMILGNNLIGLAPGPFITGMIADAAGLDVAMRLMLIASLLSSAFYFFAARNYDKDKAGSRSGATPSLETLETEVTLKPAKYAAVE